MRRDVDFSKSVFGFPASILRFNEEQAQQRQLTVEKLTRLARSKVPDPSVFDERTPYFFTALASNNRLDSYYTRMAKTSLTNYSEDANAGVSFQNSHRCRELSLGRSLMAELRTTAGGLVLPDEFGGATDDLIELIVDYYTLPQLRLTEINTDDFIVGIRGGLVADVSIGFYGGDFICSICGLDLWDWDCPHIPGIEYQVTDNAGHVTGTRRAFAWIENARLAETSAVYEGATPGAAILKAQMEAESGRIRPEQAAVIRSRYLIDLPDKRTQIAVTKTTGEAETMTGQNQGDRGNPAPPAPNPTDPQPPADQRAADPNQSGTETGRLLEQLRAILSERETAETELLAGFREMLATPDAFRGLVSLAEDGRRYRNDLIAEAIKQGGRAYGTNFKESEYLPILRSASIAVIKRFIEDWKGVADRSLTGGRKTVEGEAETDREPQTATLPQPILGAVYQ